MMDDPRADPHEQNAVLRDATAGRKPPDALGRAVERISPEGRPARPVMRSRQILRLMFAMAAVLVFVGLLVAIFVHPIIGLVGMIGSFVMLAVNPELWATISRYKERKRAEETLK